MSDRNDANEGPFTTDVDIAFDTAYAFGGERQTHTVIVTERLIRRPEKGAPGSRHETARFGVGVLSETRTVARGRLPDGRKFRVALEIGP